MHLSQVNAEDRKGGGRGGGPNVFLFLSHCQTSRDTAFLPLMWTLPETGQSSVAIPDKDMRNLFNKNSWVRLSYFDAYIRIRSSPSQLCQAC